jgi:hypothetical protein
MSTQERTDYLPAALTRLLLTTPDVSLDEIMEDLESFFSGAADVDEVARELAALELAGSITSYSVKGILYYTDDDEDGDA